MEERGTDEPLMDQRSPDGPGSRREGPGQDGLALRCAALSDVGRVRRDNQDSGFASAHLLAVADGVGGAARGDLASCTAVQILRRLDEPPAADMLEALAGAVHRVHTRLAEMVEDDPELEGTSTTITAALFDGDRLGMAHIGDSRGYLLRAGELSQLTKDHTFVQSLIDEGRITEEESRDHPHKNLILRAVDAVHDTDPDLFYVEMVPGDRVLLCSDGCSGVLDRPRLADILGSGSVDYAAVELIRASLEAGSADNITCVVAELFDPSAPGQAPPGAGPVVVGAVAELPRRGMAAGRSLFRGHRGGDTGEIPAVSAAAADPEELRYAPREPRHHPWMRRTAAVVVALVLIAVACGVAYGWSQRQYYVAASGQRVAIFKGVPADVPGLRMHSVAQTTRVTLASLPVYRAQQVRAGIDADSFTDAHDIVARLTGLARVCPSPSPTPGASPSSSPRRTRSHRPGASSSAHPRRASGSVSPHRRRRHTASASPTTAPSPSPTPTVKPPRCIERTTP